MVDAVIVGFGKNGISKHYTIDNVTLATLLSIDPALILGSGLITDNVTGGAVNSPYLIPGGGIVNASYTSTPSDESYVFTAQGWNVVKNISAVAVGTDPISFTASSFVHADLDFSGVTGDVSLYALNTKRGNYATGSGDDHIEITTATNDSGWSNLHLISTGSGEDTVIIGLGDEAVKNSTIVNFIDGRFTKTEAFLGEGNDTFNSLDSNVATKDLVRAGDGDDTVYSGRGDDYVSGDAGNDLLYGGDGNDTLKGQIDNDRLFGENGSDILWGNDGNDKLYGGAGSDWMKGGNGSDVFILGAGDIGIDTIDDLRLSKGDYLQIKDLLSFDPLTDAISDFVSISNNGIDSFVSVDTDGALNGQGFVNIAVISGITGLSATQLYADGDLVISNILP